MPGDRHVPDDPYGVLGVPRTATTAEIRSAYLALARRHHPDRMSGRPASEQAVAARRMAQVNAAWTLLSDPARRAAFDAADGAAAGSGARTRDPGGGFTPFDEGDDDVDPRLLDDTPSGARPMRRSLSMLPVGLAGAGAVVFGAGALLGFVNLLGLGLGLFLLSGASFLLLPLLALLASARADRDP